MFGIGRFFKNLGQKTAPDPLPVLPEMAAWFAAKGDTTYRLQYNALGPDSVVFDLGGYEGKWSMDIFCRYAPNIYIFEPIPAYCREIRTRFEHNPKVNVFEFGFGAAEGEELLHLGDDASSVLHGGGDTIRVAMQKISRFILENDISAIDLVKINIEGSEYDVIQDLYDASLLDRVKNLQIQFHDFVPEAEAKLQKTHAILRKTHTQDWAFTFVWENWSLTKNSA